MCDLMESFLTVASGMERLLLAIGLVVVLFCLCWIATRQSPQAYLITQMVVGVMGGVAILILPLVNPDPYGCRIDPGICAVNYPRVDLHCYR